MYVIIVSHDIISRITESLIKATFSPYSSNTLFEMVYQKIPVSFRLSVKISLQRETSGLLSTNKREQVLLMYKAAQKNKNKASEMMEHKDLKDALVHTPGLLTKYTYTRSKTVSKILL